MSLWRRNILATHEEAQPVAAKPFTWPGDHFLGVALPCKAALYRSVVVVYKDTPVIATVWDIGPWCLDDMDYVFGEERPRAEIYKGKLCPMAKDSNLRPSVPDGKGGYREVSVSNGAGIDLFPGTAKALGIPLNQNVMVDWQFID